MRGASRLFRAGGVGALRTATAVIPLRRYDRINLGDVVLAKVNVPRARRRHGLLMGLKDGQALCRFESLIELYGVSISHSRYVVANNALLDRLLALRKK